jgi:hypothetical protein
MWGGAHLSRNVMHAALRHFVHHFNFSHRFNLSGLFCTQGGAEIALEALRLLYGWKVARFGCALRLRLLQSEQWATN